MERIATIEGEWACTGAGSGHPVSIADKMLCAVLGIVKDTLVMSVVVMMGAALALFLG